MHPFVPSQVQLLQCTPANILQACPQVTAALLSLQMVKMLQTCLQEMRAVSSSMYDLRAGRKSLRLMSNIKISEVADLDNCPCKIIRLSRQVGNHSLIDCSMPGRIQDPLQIMQHDQLPIVRLLHSTQAINVCQRQIWETAGGMLSNILPSMPLRFSSLLLRLQRTALPSLRLQGTASTGGNGAFSE